MKYFFFFCLLWLGVVGGGRAQTAEVHPRLFITAPRLAEIKQAIREPGAHHQQAFAELKKRVDQQDYKLFGATGDNWNYARAYLAQAAAFLYQLTGEDRYAAIAYKTVQDIFNDPDPGKRLPYSEDYGDKKRDPNYGLSRATVGLGLAYAYDWCYNGWTAQQRAYVLGHLNKALDSWETYRHGNLQSSHRASNWVAVCRGGELVMLLSVYGDKSRPARFGFLKRELHQNLQNAYGPTGFTQEGNGYAAYSGIYLLPAIYALQSIGDHSLDAFLTQKQWWKWILYASSFVRDGREPAALTLQSGVSGIHGDTQGWMSLNLAAVPKEMLPYYLYFYDRQHGRLSPLPAARKYEPQRTGTVWSLLYYPQQVQAKDPSGLPQFRALADEHSGIYFFRNRWRDAGDVHLSVMSDSHQHSHAWDQPETGQITLTALGHSFFSGPGKYRDAALYSTLLVDGQNHPQQKGNFSLTGKTEAFVAAPDGGGLVRLSGGSKYQALGLEQMTRQVFTTFSNNKVPLVLSLADQVKASKPHAYTVNFNLGNLEKFEVQTHLSENNMPVFLIKAADGTYLKGWVVQGDNLEIKTKKVEPRDSPDASHPYTSLQLETKATTSDIWLVMAAGTGQPVKARRKGRGHKAYWQLGNTRLRRDAASGQIQADQR